MLYYTAAVTICLLVFGFLYYIKCRKTKDCDKKLDLVVGKYVGLIEEVGRVQKEYNNLADKYRYKLSMVAVLQDKLTEASRIVDDLQKKYNLLYQAYNENKDDLRFAEAILSGTPEEI